MEWRHVWAWFEYIWILNLTFYLIARVSIEHLNGCGMPTEGAYSSGHLVLSQFGTCTCSNVETNLSWTCHLSGLLSFEHPSVLLFLLSLGYFGITHTLVPNFSVRVPSVKTVPKSLRKLKVFLTKWIYINNVIDVFAPCDSHLSTNPLELQ